VTNVNGQGGKSPVPYTYGALNLQGSWSGMTAQALPSSMSVNAEKAVTLFMVRSQLTESTAEFDVPLAPTFDHRARHGRFAEYVDRALGCPGDHGLC